MTVKPDPPGYTIEHAEGGLELTRLVDRKVIGVFETREQIDDFVAADPETPDAPATGSSILNP